MDNKPDDNNLNKKLYEPGDLYQETFDRVLFAYIKAVKKCGGNPNIVTISDIESVSDLDPNMLEMYYKNTTVIVNEVVTSLQSIIKEATESVANLSQEEALTNLLTLLSKRPLLIKAIEKSGRTEFWYNNLKNYLFLISEWDNTDDSIWADVYAVFCFQFNQALFRWTEQEYQEDHIPKMTNRLSLWLRLDGEYIRHINAASNNV